MYNPQYINMTNVVLAPARGFPPVWLEDDSVYMYTRAVDHLFVRILYCTDEGLHTYFVLHAAHVEECFTFTTA